MVVDKRARLGTSIAWWTESDRPSFAILTQFPEDLAEDYFFSHLCDEDLGRLSSGNKRLHNKLLPRLYEHYMKAASRRFLPSATITTYRRDADSVFRIVPQAETMWTWVGYDEPPQLPMSDDNYDQQLDERYSVLDRCLPMETAFAQREMSAPLGGHKEMVAVNGLEIKSHEDAYLTFARENILRNCAEQTVRSLDDPDLKLMRFTSCMRYMMHTRLVLQYEMYDWHVYTDEKQKECKPTIPPRPRNSQQPFANLDFARLRALKDDQSTLRALAQTNRKVVSYKLKSRVRIDKATVLRNIREVVPIPETTMPEDVTVTLDPDPEDDFNAKHIWSGSRVNVEYRKLAGVDFPQVVVESTAKSLYDIVITVDTTMGTLTIKGDVSIGVSEPEEVAKIIKHKTGTSVGYIKHAGKRELRAPFDGCILSEDTFDPRWFKWRPRPKPDAMLFHGNQSAWRLDASVTSSSGIEKAV